MRLSNIVGLTVLMCVAGCGQAREQMPPTAGIAGAAANGGSPLAESDCSDDQRKVCGSDRLTYFSSCHAEAAAAAILHDGPCTVSDCAAIGGRVEPGRAWRPNCADDEIEHGWLVFDSGEIFLEGALCCLPK